MREKNIFYFVEGDDEKKLLAVLKTDLKMILPGKIQKHNVVEKKIPDAILRTFKNKTVVVLVFDTDTNQVNTLKDNIRKLQKCSVVSEVITIPQVPNLEGELIRSCNVKKIADLLDSQSASEFKSDFLRITNLDTKLKEHQFDIDLFWSQNPREPYQDIKNGSKKIKILS